MGKPHHRLQRRHFPYCGDRNISRSLLHSQTTCKTTPKFTLNRSPHSSKLMWIFSIRNAASLHPHTSIHKILINRGLQLHHHHTPLTCLLRVAPLLLTTLSSDQTCPPQFACTIRVSIQLILLTPTSCNSVLTIKPSQLPHL